MRQTKIIGVVIRAGKIIWWALLIATMVVLFVVLILGMRPAHGDETQTLREPPAFGEFERWFGPAPRGNERTKQLFDATKLLLDEMDRNPRDLQSAAETISCKLTPDQWQDVIGVAFSYRIWQEIYLLRNEVGRFSVFSSELTRLETLLKTEFQKILDGQAGIEAKLKTLQESVDELAKKIGPQLDDLLANSKKQIGLLNDILSLLKGMDVKIDRIEGKVDQLLQRPITVQLEPQPKSQAEWKPLAVWSDEQPGPKSFWLGLGAIAQQRIYENSLGFFWDDVFFHSRFGSSAYIEGGARRFLIKDLLAAQIFGGVGSSWFAGTGLVFNIEPLSISLSGGAQYFPEYWTGNLGPVQLFAELSHEGKWTRLSLRVSPLINLGQLTFSGKF